MVFQETILKGAYVIDLERREDPRGYFARAFCQREFEEVGLAPVMVQTNVSYNKKRGTLRGMHYQSAPHEEAKLVRCTRGSIYDVIVDVRPQSETFRRWVGVELTPETGRMLYVPEGFAHGFITLEDDTEVTYQVSAFYAPGYERGLRYDDPAIGIEWPVGVEVVSEKDGTWPDFSMAGELAVPSV